MEAKELLADIDALVGWPRLQGQLITFKRRKNCYDTQESLQSRICSCGLASLEIGYDS